MSETEDRINLEIATRLCADRGWELLDTAGRGGTAPVYTVRSDDALLALKLMDKKFSEGESGEKEERRTNLQLEEIGVNSCPHLVDIHDGGRFEDRLFLLMNKAPGGELAKRLNLVPRDKISTIVDQVAKACMFLRERGFCHRDLKSENVFVTDDFSHTTLLDIAVTRDIDDPIGIGTDHGDQLPIVATARYSPPEYLFRLIPPGPELWHAVDIYQLGGLIHDLVMREEMFESEYRASQTNRYRFAWIVATRNPVLAAEDVDPRLLLLGRRALDKDWERRSTLQLDDFLDTTQSATSLGLGAMGFDRSGETQNRQPVQLRQIVQEYAGKVEQRLVEYLREKGITASHEPRAGQTDKDVYVKFEWNLPDAQAQSGFRDFVLEYNVSVTDDNDQVTFEMAASLNATGEDDNRTCTVALPPVAMSEDAEGIMLSSCIGAIGDLGAQLMIAPEEES